MFANPYLRRHDSINVVSHLFYMSPTPKPGKAPHAQRRLRHPLFRQSITLNRVWTILRLGLIVLSATVSKASSGEAIPSPSLPESMARQSIEHGPILTNVNFSNTFLTFDVLSSYEAIAVIESSLDLMAWRPIHTNAVGAVPWRISESASTSGSRFYRIRLVSSHLNTSEETLEVGDQGGVITLPDGAEIKIPSGALPSPTQLVFRKTTVSATEADAVALAGTVVYEFEHSGLSPTAQLQGHLPLPEALRNEDSSTILVLFQREEGGPWEPVFSVSAPPDDFEVEGFDAYSFDEDRGTVLFSLPIGFATESSDIRALGNKRKRSRVRTTRVETSLEPNSAKTVYYLKQQEVTTIVDPITKKPVQSRSLLFQIPFHLDVPLMSEHHVPIFKFLVTEDHSETDLTYHGKNTWFHLTKMTQDKPPKTVPLLKTRNVSKVSHVVLHDLGNTERGDQLTTVQALRNIVNGYTLFAHYYIDAEGTIFQVAAASAIANHALSNNDTTIGIEMEPRLVSGSFSPRTVEASANLTAYLIRTMLLPYDPDIETQSRDGKTLAGTFFDRGVQTPVTTTQANGKTTTTLITRLPGNARHVSVVGHGEIQGNRTDPRGLDWASFSRKVSGLLNASLLTGPGPLVDCSGRGETGSLNGGNISFEVTDNIANGNMPDDVIEVPPLTTRSKDGGTYKKVYIGEGSTVTWNIDGVPTIKCDSFFLGRGATLKLLSTSGGTAAISVARQLQIDGKIDGSGASTGHKPVNILFTTGADEMSRIPSFVTRGGNSNHPLTPGGNGGNVIVRISSPRSKAIFWGRSSHLDSESFPIAYPMRQKSEYSGFGGTSFLVSEGRLLSPGTVTSGGSGCGAVDLLEQGGAGGNIQVLTGTSEIIFVEPIQFVSGAGSHLASLSPLEVLTIRYQNGDQAIFPSGGNGGRGRVSFGNIAGGDGGSGGNAGNIEVGKIRGANSWIPGQISTFVLSTPSRTSKPIHAYTDSSGAMIARLSAIGGSGGPKGGDTTTGSKGNDGTTGTDGAIVFGGNNLQ